MTVDFSTYRGDDFTLSLEFKDSQGSPINITGWFIYFTLKKNINDSDDAAVIKKDIANHSDPENGKTEISLSNIETDNLIGEYLYDVQYKDGTGKIKTSLKGQITFEADITRRIS